MGKMKGNMVKMDPQIISTLTEVIWKVSVSFCLNQVILLSLEISEVRPCGRI